jgi:HJR/Mrr/RecB family endonuclease
MRSRPAVIVLGTVAALVAGRAAVRWWHDHGHTVLVVAAWSAPLVVAALFALVAYALRVRRREREDVARLRGRQQDLTRVHPAKFEQITADLLTRDGCTRTAVTGRSGDGGVDVRAVTPAGHRLVVQCKRYAAASRIGPDKIRELAAVATHERALALLVTTATFTDGAVRAAEQFGVGLVDGPTLNAWRAARWSPLQEAVT